MTKQKNKWQRAKISYHVCECGLTAEKARAAHRLRHRGKPHSSHSSTAIGATAVALAALPVATEAAATAAAAAAATKNIQ